MSKKKSAFERRRSLSSGRAVVMSLCSVFLGAGLFLTIVKPSPGAELPNLGSTAEFQLTSPDGTKFESSTLHGKPWVLSFFFTRCKEVCPTLLSGMASFYRQIPADSRAEMVSVSVDPERDSPAVLESYSKKFKTEGNRWHFLTGDSKSWKDLANSVLLGAPDSPSVHSTRVVLIDTEMHVRGFYSMSDVEDRQRLKADLARLEQKRRS